MIAEEERYNRTIALNAISDAAGSKGIQPIITGLNVPFAIDMQDWQEKAVSRWFHTDVFLALTQADSRMTATEVHAYLDRCAEIIKEYLINVYVDYATPGFVILSNDRRDDGQKEIDDTGRTHKADSSAE